jgi:NADPH:quinone reductase-like Zn-dependent oxidoreductase
MADLVPVRGDRVLPLPDAVTYEDAASFILANMTAWRMVMTQGQLRAGQDVLILGVGGGVSSTAVQIAKLAGARVFVTSSSDVKLERARQLGADVGINYTRGSHRCGRFARADVSSPAAPRPARSARPTSASSSGTRSRSSAPPWPMTPSSTT